MPNPHFDVKIISRKAGQSAVACASYRSGEKLFDATIGETFDYSRKEDVLHTEVMAPYHTSDDLMQREQLWNQVEKTEKRKDAQLARDFIAGLPRELSLEQNIDLVREYVLTNFVSEGMIADFAIHESEASDGGTNPHVHIMLTMRDLNQDGESFGKKNRDWNKKACLMTWRDSWEEITNQHLEDAGSEQRLSLQSYKQQGIDKIPQKHTFVGEWKLEQRGIETETGDYNRKVKQQNAVKEIVQNRPEPDEPQLANNPVDHQNPEPSEQDSARAKQQNALGDYFRKSAMLSVQKTAELINRIGSYTKAVMEKTIELTHDETAGGHTSIFDRYATKWTDRVRDQERDRGYER